MKVIDILNRENQSIERCDQEPIHIPGAIQPHGFLLTVSAAPRHIIEYCSANCIDFFKLTAAEVLGKPVSSILSDEDCSRLSKYLDSQLFDTSFTCTLQGLEFAVSAHRVNDMFTMEFEAFPDGSLSVADQFNQTRRFLTAIQQAENFQQVCQSIASETRSITGYDRVMVYRFDRDYNGEVYAESKRDDLPGFLGHHYPHTDIPVQARELYLRNLLRIITDVNYTPVPILTLDDRDGVNKTLDMSVSILRSVSPIHIEYLKNMGVAATLTISLIENKRLWGLIACHHYAPRHVPFYTRLAAQLQGHFLTSQISVRESAAENELTTALNNRLEDLLKNVTHTDHFLQQSQILAEIANVPNATGVAIIRNDVIQRAGETPSDEQINTLLPWLLSQAIDGGYATDTLSLHFAPAADYGRIASGVIYHNLGNSDRDAMIWFRSEMDKTINWAGNPTKNTAQGGASAMLTPRKSFELWQEKVKHRSTEWLSPELNVAVKLAHILQRQFYAMRLEEDEKRYLQLNENLKKANAELANINWIGTHDLKEPLRKIQIFASRILQSNGESSEKVLDSAERMKKSATRMQELIGDLLRYSRLNEEGVRATFEVVDLNSVLTDVQEQYRDDIEEKKARINVHQLPVIHGIPFQLTQLFVNLIDNSLKFAKPNQPALINIQAEPVIEDGQQFDKVIFSDQGIGFDQVHGDKIFDVFKRLHNQQFSGTGIGLAICKKVMENHGGRISAFGNEMQGATFALYFPKL